MSMADDAEAAPAEPETVGSRAEPTRKLKRACVLLLGSHGDCLPFLDLLENIRDFMTPCLFCSEEQVELVESRGFEAVPWMSIAQFNREKPDVWRHLGMPFVKVWFSFFCQRDVISSMTAKVIAAHEQEPFDLFFSPGNADFIAYLLHDKIPVPYVRLDVVEFTPNPHAHPIVDVRFVPSFLMPVVWRAFYASVHGVVMDSGYAEACEAHGRKVLTAGEMYAKQLNTPTVIGNDFSAARVDRGIAEGGVCSLGGAFEDLGTPTYGAHVLFTPRWTYRPVEVPSDAQREAVDAFLAEQGAAGLVCFGSMVLVEETVAALLAWIENFDGAVIVMRGTSKLENNLIAALEEKKLPRVFLLLEDCPHAWLFPKCAWLVCHGGIGTTTLALRCKLPTLVVPCVADQEQTMNDLVNRGLSVRMPASTKVTAPMLDYGVTALQRDHAANWAALPDEPEVDYGAIEAFVTKHTATGRYEGLH